MEYTRKSVIVDKFGGYDCIKVLKYPLPPLEGNVEVEVKYCGLNFADLYTRLGLMPKEVPFVLGMECTGIVTKIGDTTKTNLKLGDKVICYDHNGGMYSDVIRVSPEKCYQLPEYIPLKEAATLFVNYLTAYFTLFELGCLKSRQTILIKSCAGGVGIAATQLAKTLKQDKGKVTIIGIVSEGKEAAALNIGVDFVLNHNNYIEEIKKIAPKGVDLILENETTTYADDAKLLRPLGRIVLLGSNKLITNSNKITMFSMLQTWWKSKTVNLMDLIIGSQSISGLHLGLLAMNERDVVKEALDKIFVMYQDGSIKPTIHSTCKFEDVVDATKVLAERRNIGKVLLEVD